jgi:formaldehyde-activating enzyme involved in methanogenesis
MNALAPATSFRASTESTLVDPLLVFVARAEARAMLFAAAEFGSIQTAVDPLQLYAVESGLVDRIGQDAVQQILAHSFRGAA